MKRGEYPPFDPQLGGFKSKIEISYLGRMLLGEAGIDLPVQGSGPRRLAESRVARFVRHWAVVISGTGARLRRFSRAHRSLTKRGVGLDQSEAPVSIEVNAATVASRFSSHLRWPPS